MSDEMCNFPENIHTFILGFYIYSTKGEGKLMLEDLVPLISFWKGLTVMAW